MWAVCDGQWSPAPSFKILIRLSCTLHAWEWKVNKDNASGDHPGGYDAYSSQECTCIGALVSQINQSSAPFVKFWSWAACGSLQWKGWFSYAYLGSKIQFLLNGQSHCHKSCREFWNGPGRIIHSQPSAAKGFRPWTPRLNPQSQSFSQNYHVKLGTFEPYWRPQPAKLPSFGGYSLEILPYLTIRPDRIGRRPPRFILPPLECFSCRRTNYPFFFLRLWIFSIWLAVPSKPSSQPIWLKV